MEWYYITLFVLFFILVVFSSIITWYMQYISPYPTGRISDNIAIIRTGIVNCYVYSKGSKSILIDSGTSVKKLQKRLLALKIDSDSISDVFLTHSDSDHVSGVSLFTNAQLHIGQRSKVKNPEDYHFLTNNEIVGDIKVQTISAPGHRLGHVVFRIDEEFLFTGDSMRLKKGLAKPFLRIISSDFDKQIETIKMISNLDNISIMFTAHNGFTTNFEKAMEEWKTES